MTERKRFFTLQEKLDHAENNGGWQCEGFTDKGQRCTETVLEGHHGIAYSEGGETNEDNLFLLGKVCHAIMHFISGEPWATKLIENRMTPEEKAELRRRGY
jgi:5-methylcytosine-specific restriction endonuclease McrA